MNNLIFLASYPKSGNTWCRLLLDGYAERCEARPFNVQWADIGPFFYQSVSPVPIHDLGLGVQVQIRGAALFTMHVMSQGDTVVKTHHYGGWLNGLPLFPEQWTDRVIYVVRDPRDIVASLQDHMGLEGRDETIDFMANQSASIKGETGLTHFLGSWSMHARSWADHDPLVVRYEDLHADTERETVRMLEHLGVEEIDRDRVSETVEAVRFDKLKKREQEQEFPESTGNQSEGFFRRGETGGHRDELTDEQRRRVEQCHGDQMRRLGYTTPCGAETIQGHPCTRPTEDGYCWQHSQLSAA